MGKSNYGFKKSNMTEQKYQATLLGKIAMGITAPSVIISLISVIIAFFNVVEALIVGLFTLGISFLGSILIVVDIVAFNIRQKKKNPVKEKDKEKDIGRIAHLLVGLTLGIIIGYLIWGAQ